jgi:anthranilate phosphoribosyltransferase
MEQLIGQIMEGEVAEPLVAGILVALAAKGESVGELTGAARALRSRMLRVPQVPEGTIDTCGTGGDGKGTFNVSTATAFVVAAGGVPVAKHGNRAVSSRAGSSDVVAALGLPAEVGPEAASQSLARHGLAFLFAPAHHPAMKVVAPIRRALGIRTIFNLVGPLANPAGVRRQLIGVFAAEWLEPVALVARELGAERVLVVHGSDGSDEITTTGQTQFAELVDGEVRVGWVDPTALGIPRADAAALAGGAASENAALIERILGGEVGPAADLVAINAAAAFYVSGRAKSLSDGLEMARDVLASGRALALLEQMRREGA